jgi:hypothetical protein
MWDLFICHASEDKESIAQPLAEALTRAGLKVWYDEFILTLGDSLRCKIDQGLDQSLYGVVILSPNFFAKQWPQRELAGLTTKEISTGKTILPIWHCVTRDDVERYSPILADKKAVSTECGIEYVMQEILRAIHPRTSAEPVTAHLAIEAKDGTVWFGEEKYRDSGRFTVECNFYVLVGIEPVTLLSITGLYYAYGCPSLSLPREELIIDHTEVSLALDGELRPQCELPANRRSTIRYSCSFRPPLRCTQPVDCDNGDIMISIAWRTASQLKTHVTDVIFRFTDTGIRQMEKADSLRQPPRVTDAELQAWYTEGKLTEQALEDLRKIDPWKRYMDAFNDNTTTWRGSETGFIYTRLLRELVGNPHKPEL